MVVLYRRYLTTPGHEEHGNSGLSAAMIHHPIHIPDEISPHIMADYPHLDKDPGIMGAKRGGERARMAKGVRPRCLAQPGSHDRSRLQ